MITNITNNRNQVQFGMLKTNKPFKEWNKDALNGLLRSEYFRKVIKDDADAGADTYVSYYNESSKISKNHTEDVMILNIFSPNKLSNFHASTSIKQVRNGIFGKKTEITGSKNLGQDIYKQIESEDMLHGYKEWEDIESFSPDKAIQEIEKLAGGIEVADKFPIP